MQLKIEHHQKLINLFLTIYNDPNSFLQVAVPSNGLIDENAIHLDKTTIDLLHQLRPFLDEEELEKKYEANVTAHDFAAAKAVKETRLCNLRAVIMGNRSHQLFIRLLNEAITSIRVHENSSPDTWKDIATKLFANQLTSKQKEFLGQCYTMLHSAFNVTGGYEKIEVANDENQYSQQLPSNTIRIYIDKTNNQLKASWTDQSTSKRIDRSNLIKDEEAEKISKQVQKINQIKQKRGNDKHPWEETQLLYSTISRFSIPTSPLKTVLDNKARNFLLDLNDIPEDANASCLINTEFKIALFDLGTVLHSAKEVHQINSPVLDNSFQTPYDYVQEELLDNVAKKTIDGTRYLLIIESHAKEFKAAWRDFQCKLRHCTWNLDGDNTQGNTTIKEVLESLMNLKRLMVDKINKHISFPNPTDIENIQRQLQRFLSRTLAKEDFVFIPPARHQNIVVQLLNFLNKISQEQICLPELNEASNQYIKTNAKYLSDMLMDYVNYILHYPNPHSVSPSPQQEQKFASILKEAVNPSLSILDDSLQSINASKEVTKANKQKPLEELAKAMIDEEQRSPQAAFRYRVSKEKYQEISGPELHYLLKAVKDAPEFPGLLFPCPEIKKLVAKLDNKNKEAMNQKGIYSYDQFIQAVNSAIISEEYNMIVREKSWIVPNFLASFIYRFRTDHLKAAKFQVEYLKARYQDRTKGQYFLKAGKDIKGGASHELMRRRLPEFNMPLNDSEKLPSFTNVFSKLLNGLSSLLPSNYALKKFHDLHTEKMQKMNAWKKNTSLFPVNEISATPIKEIKKMTEEKKEKKEMESRKEKNTRNNHSLNMLTTQKTFIDDSDNSFLKKAYFDAAKGQGKRFERTVMFTPLREVKNSLKQVKEIAVELDNIVLQLNGIRVYDHVEREVMQQLNNLLETKVNKLNIPKAWSDLGVDVYSKLKSLKSSISRVLLTQDITNSQALKKLIQGIQDNNHQLYNKVSCCFEKELDKLDSEEKAQYFRTEYLHAVRTFMDTHNIQTDNQSFNIAEKNALARVGGFLEGKKLAKTKVKETCHNYTQFLQAQIDIEKQIQHILLKITEEAGKEIRNNPNFASLNPESRSEESASIKFRMLKLEGRALEDLLGTLSLDDGAAMADNLKMISRYKIKEIINRLADIQPETIGKAIQESQAAQAALKKAQDLELNKVKKLSQHVRTTMKATDYLATHTIRMPKGC